MHPGSVEQLVINHDVDALILDLTIGMSRGLIVVVNLLRNPLNALASLSALSGLETLALDLLLQRAIVLRTGRTEPGSSLTLVLLTNSKGLLFLVLLHTEVNLIYVELLELVVQVLWHVLPFHVLRAGVLKDDSVFAYYSRLLLVPFILAL